MKYCPDCGRKIEDTVKICPYCLCNMEEAGFDKNIPDENTGGNNSRTGRPFSWDDSDSNTSDQQISWDSSDNTTSDPTYTADPYHTGSPEDTTADPYTNHAPFATDGADPASALVTGSFKFDVARRQLVPTHPAILKEAQRVGVDLLGSRKEAPAQEPSRTRERKVGQAPAPQPEGKPRLRHGR